MQVKGASENGKEYGSKYSNAASTQHELLLRLSSAGLLHRYATCPAPSTHAPCATSTSPTTGKNHPFLLCLPSTVCPQLTLSPDLLSNNNSVTELSDAVLRLGALDCLNLENNELKDLPPRLGHCTQLKSLMIQVGTL